MERGFFVDDLAKVSYLRWGRGDRLLIAFHGFADHSQTFEVMGEALQDDCRVYVINLPWHGETVWVKDHFDLEDIRWIIHQILQAEGQDRFELLGHSFGARIVLKLFPHYVQQLDRLHLAAADGLYKVWMYRLTWIPQSVHQQLQAWLNRPSAFIGLAKYLHQLGLMPSISYKFVEHHLSTPMRRRRLFGFWQSLRHFVLDHSSLIRQLNTVGTPVHLYMGKRDRIIPIRHAEAFVKKLSTAQLHALDKGHKVIGQELGTLIRQAGAIASKYKE